MRNPTRLIALAGVFAVVTMVVVVPVGAQTPDGGAVYQANCAACHQADGNGVPGAFPPLAGNPNVADADYVATVIRNGLSGEIDVLGTTYNNVMPAISLSDAEIEAVTTYLQALGGAAPGDGTTTTTAAATAQADPASGKDLFTGAASFANGGPFCVSCHVAGSVRHLGGSGLGPDLTAAFTRLGGTAGLTAWLSNPPSPTMAPIYEDRALTPDEIAHLAAFLETTPGQGASGGIDALWLAGIGGTVALFGLMALALRGRGPNYLQRLRSTT